MSEDERAIREVIAKWMGASAEGDVDTLKTLMAEDVVFLLAGRPPMRGRQAFTAQFKEALKNVRIDATSDIQEIQVNGDWAYCWNHLSVTMTPLNGGSTMRRNGPVLSIFRKQPGGWVISRDANLLAAETQSSPDLH